MENIKFVIEKSARIGKLIDALYEKMPEIESARGILVTESYKATEDLPLVKRRSAAFAHILENIPIVIRDNELVVGSATVSPRGCQVFPEYSYEWLEAELDTVATRAADPFYVSEKTKAELRQIYPLVARQDLLRPRKVEHGTRGLRRICRARHLHPR